MDLDKTTSKLVKEAIQSYPNECCGVLLGRLSKFEVLDIRALGNSIRDERASTHFKIFPLDVYQVEREIEGSDLEIVGFYHSHPDSEAVPSKEDAEYMVPGLVYVILSVTSTGVSDIRAYQGTFQQTLSL